MPDKGTKKKITRIDGGDASPGEGRSFTPTADSRSQALKFRIIAAVSWVIAIGFEIGAIVLLQRPPISTTWLIVLIAAALVFAVIGNLLWKKSNRLDPASEKEPVKFFIQNQLGAIISTIAFLPLVILVLTNKNMDKKQKGIVGAVAGVALLIGLGTGIDFNPPSQEKYAQETARVEQLMDKNLVYWTKSGTRYHLYSDCSAINTRKTDEIFQGTVAKARELKNINQLCRFCENKAAKEKGLQLKDVTGAEETAPAEAETR
ncbi:MAG TPA: hypothetical protein P5295_10285 [Spirochaetota bacterium]|nr:hypothetical protein [Spirochaetota bacterium]